MQTFKELFINEKSLDYTKEGVITAIMKNKHYSKNAVVFDDELYFEMKDVDGAIRLVKKLGKSIGYEEILSVNGGKIGYYDSSIEAIIGIGSKAYISITLTNGITKDVIQLTKAKVRTDAEYKSNHKKIIERD